MKWIVIATVILESGVISSKVWPSGNNPMSFDSLEECQYFLSNRPPHFETKFENGFLQSVHKTTNATEYSQCSRLSLDFFR